MNLQLERIELREIELPLKWPFETSFGRTTRRRILIVRAFDKDGASGYGECVAGENPFFNHETIDTAWLITARYVAPLLAAARVETASQVYHKVFTRSGLGIVLLGAPAYLVWRQKSGNVDQTLLIGESE